MLNLLGLLTLQRHHNLAAARGQPTAVYGDSECPNATKPQTLAIDAGRRVNPERIQESRPFFDSSAGISASQTLRVLLSDSPDTRRLCDAYERAELRKIGLPRKTGGY